MLFFISSCSYFQKKTNNNKEEHIARVGISYFNRGDLESLIPSGLTKEDSIGKADELVQNWIAAKLMEEKALDFLPQKTIENIEQKVADYRSSLYAFQYEKELIAQKLNQQVSEEEVLEYYQTLPKNNQQETKVRVRYFFVEKENQYIDSLKSWLNEENDYPVELLRKWAAGKNNRYSTNAKWMTLSKIQALLPNQQNSNDWMIKEKTTIFTDEEMVYLLSVDDIQYDDAENISEEDTDKITRILLNQRKEKYLIEIKQQLTFEGKEDGLVEIY